MAKIFALIGKSASGKNTIYHHLLQDKKLGLKPVVPYTTRPRRIGEVNGQDYWFVDEVKMKEMAAEGKVVEHRIYQTSCGEWHYFTADDGQIDLGLEENYLLITTLEGYLGLAGYFGQEYLVPLYVEADDRVRLLRMLDREFAQYTPNYAEVCRRFLADEKDFTEEKLLGAGITMRYWNAGLEECLSVIKNDIGLPMRKGAELDTALLARCRIYTMKGLKDAYRGQWVLLRGCLFGEDGSFISGKVIMSAGCRMECELSEDFWKGDHLMYVVDPADLGKRYIWEELADKFAGTDVLIQDEREVETDTGYTTEVTLVDVITGWQEVKTDGSVHRRNLPIR